MERVNVRRLPDPTIESPSDAIVRVRLAGLCGSDLHPFFGRETGIDIGTVMGHEFVGEVIAVGNQVKDIAIGDSVFAPFTTNCGTCYYCRIGLTSRCERGQLFGWRENSSGLHGGQAELVRVPLADGTLMRIPEGISDEDALLLGDNLSTGYYCAEMAGTCSGGIYAVIGCGTVGLLAISSAIRAGAADVFAIDPVESRLSIAEQLGARTFTDSHQASAAIMRHTEGRGVDAVMELVGLPDAQRLAINLVRPGGVMSVIGCHCAPNFAFGPAQAYDKNLTYRTGRCPARTYMTQLADTLAVKPFDLSWCITHRFGIDDAVEAYDTFAYRKDDCVKAVLAFN